MKITIKTEGGFGGISPPPESVEKAPDEVISLARQFEQSFLSFYGGDALENKEEAEVGSEAVTSLMADGMTYIIELDDGENPTSYTLQEADCEPSLLDLVDQLREQILKLLP